MNIEKTPTLSEFVFCKVYTDLHGEPINSIEQIKQHSMSGEDLLDLCIAFATNIRKEEMELEFREKYQIDL